MSVMVAHGKLLKPQDTIVLEVIQKGNLTVYSSSEDVLCKKAIIWIREGLSQFVGRDRSESMWVFRFNPVMRYGTMLLNEPHAGTCAR